MSYTSYGAILTLYKIAIRLGLSLTHGQFIIIVIEL